MNNPGVATPKMLEANTSRRPIAFDIGHHDRQHLLVDIDSRDPVRPIDESRRR